MPSSQLNNEMPIANSATIVARVTLVKCMTDGYWNAVSTACRTEYDVDKCYILNAHPITKTVDADVKMVVMVRNKSGPRYARRCPTRTNNALAPSDDVVLSWYHITMSHTCFSNTVTLVAVALSSFEHGVIFDELRAVIHSSYQLALARATAVPDSGRPVAPCVAIVRDTPDTAALRQGSVHQA
ncbi:hypothetical protein PENSPDRAFT_662726 [Peniophora sp. CONT]|nr:hypothetical protein PENSPDRAFT_662726 [Peniophora sp. CONT]